MQKLVHSRPKQPAMKEQLYDQAAALLQVENPASRVGIQIRVNHFLWEVIHQYNNDQSQNKPKSFVD